MLRCFVALLVAAYTLLPPGFCACRLEASLAGDHEHEHHHDQAPAEEHDDSDCGCIERSRDFVGSAAPAVEDDSPCLATVLPAVLTPPCLDHPTAADTGAVWRAGGTPLYLILRALRL